MNAVNELLVFNGDSGIQFKSERCRVNLRWRVSIGALKKLTDTRLVIDDFGVAEAKNKFFIFAWRRRPKLNAARCCGVACLRAYILVSIRIVGWFWRKVKRWGCSEEKTNMIFSYVNGCRASKIFYEAVWCLFENLFLSSLVYTYVT